MILLVCERRHCNCSATEDAATATRNCNTQLQHERRHCDYNKTKEDDTTATKEDTATATKYDTATARRKTLQLQQTADTEFVGWV